MKRIISINCRNSDLEADCPALHAMRRPTQDVCKLFRSFRTNNEAALKSQMLVVACVDTEINFTGRAYGANA